MRNSIRRQMQVWLMIPLLILLVVSAVCSYVLAMYLSREAYDQALLNSIDSITSRLIDDNGKVSVERLPRRVKALLTHDDKDEFVYEIYTEDGKLLSQNQGLPKPPPLIERGEPAVLHYELLGDNVYRVAVTRGSFPEFETGHVLIQAGETLNSRKEYRRKLLLGIVVPQMILLSLAVLAIWISIEKLIKPLKTISEVVKKRAPNDLSPISSADAPDEVKSFLNALNGLFLRVNEDMEKQHRFAANAAHQLRTPLAGMKTYIEIMEKNSKDPEFSKMLAQMNDGCDRLIRTVQQLLSLSRAEQGEVLRTYQMIDLNAVVEEALTDVVPESIKKNVELELDTPEEPVKVLGNAVSLKELTMNLLENAIKYNNSGGHVTVKVTNGTNVQLVVEDDGLGIPESERSKVFERFYRVSQSSNLDVSGSGLGLSIVSEVARLHNATVTIDSGKDLKGTKFTVTFPQDLNATLQIKALE
jgi:two-component system, OmpR family, sensor histidine kinase TctE